MSNNIFIDTLNGNYHERPPIWFMRQAGRVLPNYLKLREKYSFKQMMEDPSLCTEITLMPIFDLGSDAAILFSDILVIPEAFGMELEFTEKGPVFSSPLKEDPLNASKTLQADHSKLEYIYRNIQEICKQKPSSIPLIGFCGSPLTTLFYMIQGRSTNHDFPDAIRFIYQNPSLAKELIERITDLSISYADEQINCGIDAFQLFETHAGLLPYNLYRELMLPSLLRFAEHMRTRKTPYIFFPKGIGSSLANLPEEIADYISIDWQSSLQTARNILPKSIGVQGNLDPRILRTSKETIQQTLEQTYLPFGKENKNWIFNLGHGLTPDLSFEQTKFVFDWVKTANWERQV